MKKLALLGLFLAASSSAMPKVAATLGYPDFSIQDSMRTLHDALDSVTKAMGK